MVRRSADAAAASDGTCSDSEVTRAFIVFSRSLMTRMTRTAKNGVRSTRRRKLFWSTGMTTLSQVARTVALRGCSPTRAISPTMPPAETVSKT
jgi:hypothetical protein